MSAKRVHKAYTAASMHAADRLSLHESAADLAAGSEAEPAAAAARKGKAQLTYSRSGLQHGGSFHKGTSAEQHKGTDGQMAAMPPSHSRLRVKVHSTLRSLVMMSAYQVLIRIHQPCKYNRDLVLSVKLTTITWPGSKCVCFACCALYWRSCCMLCAASMEAIQLGAGIV